MEVMNIHGAEMCQEMEEKCQNHLTQLVQNEEQLQSLLVESPSLELVQL